MSVHGGGLPSGALTKIVLAYDAPLEAALLIVPRDRGRRVKGALESIVHQVRFTVLCVDRSNVY